MSVIVIEFVSLDGFVTDPDGSEGTPGGGWAFRHGPEVVAGDKFRLGPSLDEGVLLLGRRTWELFAGLFPRRDDPFSRRMNAAPKLVASRAGRDLSAWANSTLIRGDLVSRVRAERRDVIVAGSASVVHELAPECIDEYRLLVFPTVLGRGVRLFAGDLPATQLELVSAERVGPVVFTTYRREPA